MREELFSGLGAISRIRWLERFFNRESPASSFQDGLICARVHKLESEAESVSLADKRKDLDFAEWKAELEPNHFAHLDLGAQHGGYARLADVDGLSPNYRGIARIYANIDLELEARVAAGFRCWI